MKDSCTSISDVMDVVDVMRRQERGAWGVNSGADLYKLRDTTRRKYALSVAPITVKNGTIQNASRKRALCDPRNAISCASVWSAVASGITNGKFIHSWDEVGIVLNGFDSKQNLRCSSEGKKLLNSRNLSPATTEVQQKRRVLKIGLSEC